MLLGEEQEWSYFMWPQGSLEFTSQFASKLRFWRIFELLPRDILLLPRDPEVCLGEIYVVQMIP